MADRVKRKIKLLEAKSKARAEGRRLDAKVYKLTVAEKAAKVASLGGYVAGAGGVAKGLAKLAVKAARLGRSHGGQGAKAIAKRQTKRGDQKSKERYQKKTKR